MRVPSQLLLLTAALVSWAAGYGTADAQHGEPGCLFAVTVGPKAEVVVPCPDSDPLGLGTNSDIRRVMLAMGIEPAKIRFKGCKNLRFSVAPDGSAVGADRRYIITYPLEAPSYLAPVTHELAHVLQMEIAGSLTALRKALISKRIELGADYLTGLIFSHTLTHVDVNQFQHNLLLTGMYVERDEEAHGTPAQRTSAFRFGYINFDKVSRNMRTAHDEFQANLYARVAHF